MSYEGCYKHIGADATNCCQWCYRERVINCSHSLLHCPDCDAHVSFDNVPSVQLYFEKCSAVLAFELGMVWLHTPEYLR